MDDAQPPQAQQEEVAPSMPVASEPAKPEAPKGPPPPPEPSGLGFLATAGVAFTGMQTELSASTEGSFSGNAYLHLVGSGFSSSGVSYSARLGAMLGGGTAGMESL